MKSSIVLFLAFTLSFFSFSAFAQVKTEKINVAGECGTCKKKIETAAKKAGSSYAAWDVESKVLTVKYNSKTTSADKIEKSIAAVGYDTPLYKATDESYEKLDGCCKYDRNASSASCCDSEKCKSSECMKDGKCEKDMQCCKDSKCDQKACCKS